METVVVAVAVVVLIALIGIVTVALCLPKRSKPKKWRARTPEQIRKDLKEAGKEDFPVHHC